MAKRYWLKTGEHFFKDSHMIYLKSQKNGYEYIYLWQNLLLKCLEVDDEAECGFLRLNDKIPYSPELLSDIFSMNIDVVKAGVDIFVNLGMMSILENGTLYIESVQKMIGKESESAERVRRHREKKALLGNNDVTKSNPILVPLLNKEVEKEISEDNQEEVSKEDDNSNKDNINGSLVTDIKEKRNKINNERQELFNSLRIFIEKKSFDIHGEKYYHDGKEAKSLSNIIHRGTNGSKNTKEIKNNIYGKIKLLVEWIENPDTEFKAGLSLSPSTIISMWNKLVPRRTIVKPKVKKESIYKML